MSDTLRIKVNSAGIVGHKPGDETLIECFPDGVPRDLYWRRRLADAETDGCIEVVPDQAEAEPQELELDDAAESGEEIDT